MPTFSRYSIRTAFLYLAIGGTVGGLMLANKAVPFWPWIWQLRLTHIHAMLVGWLMHLVFGVAFWMFPRLDPTGRRGNVMLAWIAYGLISGAMGMIVIASFLPGFGWCIMLASLLETIAAVLIAVHCWPRVGPVLLHQQRSDTALPNRNRW